MELMLLKILAGFFVAFGLAVFVSFWKTKSVWQLVGSVAYAVAGLAAFEMELWWPLVAVFAVTLLFKLFGADLT